MNSEFRIQNSEFNTDWLAAQAIASPDKLALVATRPHRFERPVRSNLAYRQLNALVDGMCGRLASLHLARGSIVAAHLPSSAEYVALVHALARMGLVLAPLNTRLTSAELEAQLNHVRPALLIYDEAEPTSIPSHWEKMRAVGQTLTLQKLMALPPAPFAPAPMDLERLQSIVFTSGSSGAPKGVQITFGNLFWNAIASAARLGVMPDDRWLSVLPLFHVGGLTVIFRSCIFGTAMALHPKFDVDAVSRSLDEDAITLVSLVPTMLGRLMELRAQVPSSLRLILLGGAAASEELLAEAARRGWPVAPTYGLTEATSQVATMPPDEAARKPGSVGKPLFGAQVRILDALGEPSPNGEIGEIAVRGPTVMRSYFDNAEATAKAICQNELRTGDMGYVDAEGDLFVLQRRSDLIVTGGENVYPAEVERALRSHPKVKDALVVGLPDAEWGQRVAALVVADGITADELLAHARTTLAGYKLPRVVRFAPALPLLANGKLDRAGARAMLEK